MDELLIEEVNQSAMKTRDELVSVLKMQYGSNVDFSLQYFSPVIFSLSHDHDNNDGRIAFNLVIHNLKLTAINLQTRCNFVALNIDPVQFTCCSSHGQGFLNLINKHNHVLFEKTFDIFIKSSIKNIKNIYAMDNQLCRNFAKKYLDRTALLINYSDDPFRCLLKKKLQ